MPDVKSCIATMRSALPTVDDHIAEALAPRGHLRAGINLSNFLLVTGHSSSGQPQGVSPGMAAALGELVGRDVDYVTFESPGAVADAAEHDAWDIGTIGADPARAQFIQFTEAYCEIESTCLVRTASPIESYADVDQPGIKIGTKKRAAYTLWLERHVKHAELIQFDTMDASLDGFLEDNLDVLAGLRPRLSEDAARLTDMRVLTDRFAAVQQAIGTPKGRHPAGADYLRQFVANAKSSGLVQALIDEHGTTGKLTVAQDAP
ncbi:MAG: transporter substrate-binding domain-containing protein [Pseudomonadota bacterium]